MHRRSQTPVAEILREITLAECDFNEEMMTCDDIRELKMAEVKNKKIYDLKIPIPLKEPSKLLLTPEMRKCMLQKYKRQTRSEIRWNGFKMYMQFEETTYIPNLLGKVEKICSLSFSKKLEMLKREDWLNERLQVWYCMLGLRNMEYSDELDKIKVNILALTEQHELNRREIRNVRERLFIAEKNLEEARGKIRK